MATKKQVDKFIKTIAPLAQKEYTTRTKKLLPSVCIAQACLESGYGTSQLMLKGNAFFGIKCGSTWKGKVYNSRTKECYDGVRYVTINDCFRAYNSVEESVADYYNLICNSARYAKAVNEKDYRKCIQAIKNGGYATSPTYVENVCKIIETYNLTQYDVVDTKTTNDKYFPRYYGNSCSIADALKSVNVNNSFSYRKQIAITNGITNYRGTAEQNLKLLKLLKTGKLLK